MQRVRLGIMRDEVSSRDKDLTRTLYVEPETPISEIHETLVNSNWFPKGFTWVNNVNQSVKTVGDLSKGAGSAVIRYNYVLEV